MAKDREKRSPAPPPPGGWEQVKGWIVAVTGPWTWANLRGWLAIIALVLVIRWAWIEPYKIPSGSMEPTLHGDPGFMKGDRVFINKFHYGLRVPFANARLFHGAEPERWDLIVFRAVQEEAQHQILIKRIVGLPGEEVRIADGKVYADGEPLELPDDMPDVEYTREMSLNEQQRQAIMRQAPPGRETEFLQEAMRQVRAQPMRYGVLQDERYSVVPEGHYFVLGDNSANSIDGRHYGWVPNEHILGRAFCIWWPPGNMRDFTGFSQTWWGWLLLYGAPAAVVLFTLGNLFVFRSWRIDCAAPATGLKAGDHIVVGRLAYGLRAPFMADPVTQGRTPARGETAAYFETGGDGKPRPMVGRVVALPGEELRTDNGAVVIGQETMAALFPGDEDLAASVRAALESNGKRKQRVRASEDECVMLTAEVGDNGEAKPRLAAVPRGDFAGPVRFVWWPLSRWGRPAPNPPRAA